MLKLFVGIYLHFLLFLLISCRSANELRDNEAISSETPPNGVCLGNNLYCDQTEMTNFAWMEYMLWVESIFGKNSSEYSAVLPDTSVWMAVGDSSGIYSRYYLTHPAYRDCPVVGVSQQQAKDYSRWRSDRVFETILVRDGYINRIAVQTRENYFSRESYYASAFSGILPGKIKETYPEFRLPTTDEWIRIEQFADSVHATRVEECTSMKCRECLSRYKVLIGVDAFRNGETIASPTADVYEACWKDEPPMITHIRGNVREWLPVGDGTIRESLCQCHDLYAPTR